MEGIKYDGGKPKMNIEQNGKNYLSQSQSGCTGCAFWKNGKCKGEWKATHLCKSLDIVWKQFVRAGN